MESAFSETIFTAALRSEGLPRVARNAREGFRTALVVAGGMDERLAQSGVSVIPEMGKT